MSYLDILSIAMPKTCFASLSLQEVNLMAMYQKDFAGNFNGQWPGKPRSPNRSEGVSHRAPDGVL